MNRKTASFVLFASILAFCLMVSLPLRAQVTGATISGTITDASGGVIVGAQVSVRNTATGIIRSTTADSAGFYTVPNLIPGPYEVKVTAMGFTTAVQSNLTLAVGAQQSLNIPMKVGETSQTVQVTEAAPQNELTSSTLSGQVESHTVLELPLNGRDWASLATLSPGVNALETQMPFESGAVRGNRGFGAQLTISGGRPTQNNYRLDGLSINDYGNGGPGSVIGVSLGVDAIQEFSVLTGNYSAEYGRTSGGVVNAISKSGTNAFHGDLYEFLRNDKLDANDFFLNSSRQPKPAYRRNQFGGAAGGPIRKDRTFIFGDYESIRLVQGIAVSSSVPSDAARAGNLANGTHITVDPAVSRFLVLFPHANGPQNGDIGAFNLAATRAVTENYYTLRGDHKISDKDNLFATYAYDRTPFTQPDGFKNVQFLSRTIRHIAALEESHIFSPNFANSARGGFNRNAVINNRSYLALNPAAADPAFGATPGGFNPVVRIGGGFTALIAGLGGTDADHVWNSFQFYDDAFLTRGTHSMKFGFAVERMQYDFFQLSNPWGTWRFNSLKDFLLNSPASFAGAISGNDWRGSRQTLFAGYIQDDWRVNKKLTLNVGLRYEMVTVLSEVNGKLTNLVNMTDRLPQCGTSNPALTTIFGQPGCSGVGPLYNNPTKLNFEPRFGFAWDPKGDGKTAIRGGFAIFDVLPLPGYFFISQSVEAPFLKSGIVNNSNGPLAGIGVLANTPGSALSKFGPASLVVSFLENNLARNYQNQWQNKLER